MNAEIVTDPRVLARLPRAGGPTMQCPRFWDWCWTVLGQASPARFRVPRFGLKILLLPFRTRTANASTLIWGPFMWTRPEPWLLHPAKVLHPEAFKDLES